MALPLAKGSAINVWGWASNNPIYGGTGSGSLSKDNPTTTLLDGLHNAGVTTNDELTNLCTSYRAERPKGGGVTDPGTTGMCMTLGWQ